MTSEQTYDIPKQPFPSCLSIDQTVGYLQRALKALEHAPECADTEKAKVFIEEGIEDVEVYREIHSNMRSWGQAWKDAFLANVKGEPRWGDSDSNLTASTARISDLLAKIELPKTLNHGKAEISRPLSCLWPLR